MNVILVDDELSGRETLAKLLKEHAPDIKVVAMASSAAEAIKAINSFDPDLVFLDVQMPQVNGFEMLEQLNEIDFEVVFVTAYNEFAVKAFKYSALDYLLKPLDIEDLLDTLKRVREKNQSLVSNTKQFQVFFENMKVAGSNPMRIAIPDATGFVFLELEKIIRVEGISNSSKLYLVDGKVYTVARMITEFEQLFGESFCRVHKKHLINLKHAVQYIKGDGGEIRMSDGYNVEVSRRKKQEVMNRIKQLH